MKKEVELVIQPEFIEDSEHQKKLAAHKLKLNVEEITAVQVIRRSIDARSKNPVYRAKVNVYVNEEPSDQFSPINFQPVKGNKKVIIV